MKKHFSALFVVLLPIATIFVSGGCSMQGQPVTILAQPFDDLSPQQAAFVFGEIKKVYSNAVLLKSIGLPANSFYRPRNRYRADTIIKWLSDNTKKGFVTIGLTSKDISTNKDPIPDWGVMGLGFQPGRACVASAFRLNKQNLLEQFFKVSIHELGHTQGLAHCNVRTCYMRDAEGHNTTDEETGFCPKCKQKLIDKGWIIAE